MKVRRTFIMAVTILFSTFVAAQEDKVETTVGADIVSQYIWRGQDLGNVSLQPTLGVGY